MYAVYEESLLTSFQEVVQKAVLEIFDGKGMPAILQTLREGMNRNCSNIQQRVMVWIDNQLRQDPWLREGWVIVRRDHKTIGSPFGEVRYERTLFRNKKRKVLAYLADRLVGYKPHQRLDSLLDADLLVEAVDLSYAKAARSLEIVSGIRVSCHRFLNIVRMLQPEER